MNLDAILYVQDFDVTVQLKVQLFTDHFSGPDVAVGFVCPVNNFWTLACWFTLTFECQNLRSCGMKIMSLMGTVRP